jgi:hypothetical protein
MRVDRRHTERESLLAAESVVAKSRSPSGPMDY